MDNFDEGRHPPRPRHDLHLHPRPRPVPLRHLHHRPAWPDLDISQWDGGAPRHVPTAAPNVIEARTPARAPLATGHGGKRSWGLGLRQQPHRAGIPAPRSIPAACCPPATSCNIRSTPASTAPAPCSAEPRLRQRRQPTADGKIVVAGISGSSLEVIRYNTNGSRRHQASAPAAPSPSKETSPTFAKLTIDASGNIDVAVIIGSNVEVYQLSDTGAQPTGAPLLYLRHQRGAARYSPGKRRGHPCRRR